ncbi:MAG: MFS transporter [Kordiimonadales bacterium]|nr:MAG: MFS transporter [Kordiimonadales bacterium]
MLQLIKDRNFLTYWIGQFVSVVGDHISFIAFPFLVLQLTDSGAMMGLVFAVQGLPRAALMLMGGAVVDRYSPRLVMMVSNIFRFAVIMLMAYLIYVDQVTLEVIFIAALSFGVVDAFFYPASIAIVPALVVKDMLQKANALVHGSIYVGVIIGPAIGGLIIAGEVTTLGHGAGDAATYESNRLGFARAFFIDGLTFLASFLTLLFVRARVLGEDDGSDEPRASMIAEVVEGIKWVWSKPTIRLGFLGIAVIEFFFQAPIFIGLPMLTKVRFLEPTYIYGIIIAAWGAGALIGSVLAGSLKPIPERFLVRIMFSVFIASGAALGLVIVYEPYWWAMLVFFIAGIGDSFVMLNFTTWVQKKTPEKLLGRVMSIFTFMSVGLVPVAAIALGSAFEWNLELTLIIVSGILVVSCLIAALHKDAEYRNDGEEDKLQEQS